jgi:cAMP-dependent protein kinase regulator
VLLHRNSPHVAINLGYYVVYFYHHLLSFLQNTIGLILKDSKRLFIMGCAASKHATATTAKAGGAGGAGSGGGDQSTMTTFLTNPLSVLNPAVAMENLWSKTQDIGKMGDHVFKEGAHHLRVIFAKPFDSDMSMFSPPIHSKTDEEKAFIEKALLKNFVFEGLSHQELVPLIGAFEKEPVEAGTKIITEGEEGDYFYIILSGAVEFSVKGKVVGAPATAGASFGELALLYTCPRAATALAKENTVLFRVDQKSFRYILQSKAKEGEGRKNRLLKDVKFLHGLNDMDLSKLAASMTPLAFRKGEILGKKGDEVAYFWIVETGELLLTEIEAGGKKYEDTVIGPGGYFGQYAIISEQPRLGNLIAKSDGMAFRIEKATFKQVIGDLDLVLIRSADKIALVSEHFHCYPIHTSARLAEQCHIVTCRARR